MRMFHLLRLPCVCALFLCCVAAVTNATTISLKRGGIDPTFYPGGYNGVADSTIFYHAPSSGATFPALWMRSSDGAYSLPGISNSGSGSRRDLLRFSLSGMSGQNVMVTSDAQLTIYTYTDVSSNTTIGLYEIAAANAGWTESTNNVANNPTAAAVKANNGDPTWYYKSIDTINNTPTTSPSADSTSITWASGQNAIGNAGSNPEGYANTGGLWNWIDLVDQNPATVANTYLTMNNMDPVATAPWATSSTMVFTIPRDLIQDWIDNSGDNAGLLVRSNGTVNTRFRSSESGATQRPTLTFDYVVVPEPATLTMLGLGLLGFLRRR